LNKVVTYRYLRLMFLKNTNFGVSFCVTDCFSTEIALETDKMTNKQIILRQNVIFYLFLPVNVKIFSRTEHKFQKIITKVCRLKFQQKCIFQRLLLLSK